MSNVTNLVAQFFSWLGGYTSLLTNNVVIAVLVFLLVGIPLILSLIRRHIL